MIPVARVRLSWWGRVKAWLFGCDRARALCATCHEPMSLYDGDQVARYCIACEIDGTRERDVYLATRVAPKLLDALAEVVRRQHLRSWTVRTIGAPDRTITDHEIEDVTTPYAK